MSTYSQQRFVAIAMISLLAFSFLLGGASRQHELRLAVVELASLPLLLLGVSALLQDDSWRRHRFALAIMAGLFLLPLIQLIPLPPAIWTSLPGRSQPALGLEVAGIAPGWLPLTLSPDKTWRSILALLPPAAIFIAALGASTMWKTRYVQFVLVATAVSVLLGAAQLASGGERLYPWTSTDAGNVVGFFANRNHLATLCLIAIPFAAVMAVIMGAKGAPGRENAVRWTFAMFIVLMLFSLAVIRSRAGIILAGPVVIASVVAVAPSMGWRRPGLLPFGLAGFAALTVTALAVFASGPILERFDTSGAKEGRFENWPTVLQAAEAHLPLGSGFGSFDAVFRSFEPLEDLDPTYFNQAHNDYLETWLEAGWLGIALLVVFLVWFSRRTLKTWTTPLSARVYLQRAATIAIGLVLLHSAGDYPLRTETIATIFALCCALLESVNRERETTPAVKVRRRLARSEAA